MPDGPTTSPVGVEPRRTLTLSRAASILWDCAWEAVLLAFLVGLFGSIALGIVGGIWHDMTPSPPPGFERPALPEADPAASFSFEFFRQHSFVLLAAVFFLLKSAARFAEFSGREDHRQAGAWVHRILQHAGRNWFGLIVGNAFGALVATIILQFSGQFSFTQLLWRIWVDLLLSFAHGAGHLLPHFGWFDRLSALWDWYSGNRFKFTFWFFYVAALCDDLGLPNFKTLGRCAWRRLCRRTRPVAVPCQKENPSAGRTATAEPTPGLGPSPVDHGR